MRPHPVDPVARAAWTSELLYGTLTVLIALAGVEIAGPSGASPAGAIVLVGSIATWLAHAYASVLGRRAVAAHQPTMAEVTHALRHAFPILIAAIPSVLAFAGAALGLWQAQAAATFSNVAGIAVLAGAGWVAGMAAQAPLSGKIWSAVLAASFGVVIVAIELVLHH